MSVFHTVWPDWSSLRYVASEYANCWCRPYHQLPFYSEVVEKPSAKNNRTFLLNRSVFDLVEAHQYLSLTDPKLLGWYLCLSPEDRRIIQDEGGFHYFLQRHPALELSQHYVFAKKMPHKHLNSEMPCSTGNDHVGMDHTKYQPAFNSPVTQELSYQGAHTVRALSHVSEQRPSWQQPSSGAAVLCRDPAALRGWQHELRGQMTMTQGHNANYTYPEFHPLRSEWAPTEKDFSPEYYSFDSPQMDGTEHRDGSSVQPAEIKQVSPPLDPVGGKSAKERSQDHAVDDEASLSFDQSDFHSIMENDESILACLTSEDVKTLNGGVHSDLVSTDSEAGAKSETCNIAQSVMNMTAAERYTSPMPCATTCDVMVGTELTECMVAVTQTEDLETADKHVITEVHMADLDYLAEAFIKLKMAQEEAGEQREKMKSLGCKLGKECECLERAQRAELCLLALQYSMCRQHCCRLHYISAEGGQLTQMPNGSAANIDCVLQKLEADYNQMREKILAGVPLEQLHPLSVDSEKISTGASYIPAQIIGDMLGNVPSWSSQKPQKLGALGVKNGRTNGQSTDGCKTVEDEKLMKSEVIKTRRAATLVPQQRRTIPPPDKSEEKLTATCEAWYDAEENLDPAGPDGTGLDPTEKVKPNATESASEEAKSCNPASHVTELVSQPPLGCSVKTRKVVYISPTTKGTCVPQHYGTMGSFDTLMAELTQRHPDVGRQRIVDALMELKTKHQGVLSGLPLRTIREMTSELLTRSANATQS